MHGGAPGSGRPVKHGRTSAWAKVLGPVWEGLKDETLTDLTVNARLLLAREMELSARLEEGDSPEFRKVAMGLLTRVRSAARAGDAGRLAEAMTRLEEHLSQGASRDQAWKEVLTVSKAHADLVEQMNAIETRSAHVLTGRGIVALLGTLFDLVRLEAGEEIAYRVGQRFQTVTQADVGAGATLPALPPAGAGEPEEPAPLPG